MIEEFKKFALKGNVVDLALAVVIGGAFGKIVSSLVQDIIMPPIGLVTGGVDFANLKVAIAEEVFINYGAFINTIIDFIIIAIALFIVIKQMNKLQVREEKKEKKEEKPSKEVELLTEIRDSLKK